MKIRCSMVISPNGFISKLDGNEDWIAEVNWDDFVKDAETSQNFIVGRKTYEKVPELDEIKATHKVVVSSKPNLDIRQGYVIVRTPKEARDYLKSQNVEEALLAGGGELNASFATANLIDELELVLVPYLISQGRPVFAPHEIEFPLEFVSATQLSEGRAKVLYRVKPKT